MTSSISSGGVAGGLSSSLPLNSSSKSTLPFVTDMALMVGRLLIPNFRPASLFASTSMAATAGRLSVELEENKASAKAMRDQRKDEQLALDGKIEDAKKGLKGEDLHGGAYDGMDVDRPKRRGKRTRMPFGK